MRVPTLRASSPCCQRLLSDLRRTLVTTVRRGLLPLSSQLPKPCFVDGGDTRVADLDQAGVSKGSQGSTDHFSDGTDCRRQVGLMDGMGDAYLAIGQRKEVVSDAGPNGLEGNSGNLGQDVIEEMGQVLGSCPAHFRMTLADLIEPRSREAKNGTRGNGLEGKRELPSSSTAGSN